VKRVKDYVGDSISVAYQNNLQKSTEEAKKVAQALATASTSRNAVSSNGTTSKYVFAQSMTVIGDTASLEIVPEKVHFPHQIV